MRPEKRLFVSRAFKLMLVITVILVVVNSYVAGMIGRQNDKWISLAINEPDARRFATDTGILISNMEAWGATSGQTQWRDIPETDVINTYHALLTMRDQALTIGASNGGIVELATIQAKLHNMNISKIIYQHWAWHKGWWTVKGAWLSFFLAVALGAILLRDFWNQEE